MQGGIIGANANLSSLDGNGDIKFAYDYRQIYTSILKDHFGMTTTEVKDILLKDFTTLPILKPTTDIQDYDSIPTEFSLAQNYPNPFNPTTTIHYQLSEFANVSLKVYDVLGNEIATLVDQSQHAGKYNVRFDGSRLASGTYIYTLRTNSFTQTKKMLLVK
ncbi:MAG: hypothetical protein A2X62_09835 [Stygiobacter sp. GWC2_38_9]|nr:MAG: hypothetical protein A2X62_09835 [Stygiobacter sp. GWC2_38_9]